jgi:dolichol-phosphate mannosyltransferase
MIEISVVVPLYNEKDNVKELCKRLKVQLDNLGERHEIILVDDGSQDGSWNEIVEQNKIFPEIKGIRFSRNFGHHYAITAGLFEATGKWVVVMDGDLQDRPEAIPLLLERAKEGFDVVFVSRQNRPESFYYKTMQKIFYKTLNILSGINFDSTQANFSIISRKVVENFKKFPENARFYGSTIMWLGFNRSSVTADHGTRFSGKPSYTFRKRFKLAMDIIVAFSVRPLKIATSVGILMSLMSFIGGIVIVFGVLTEGFTVSGWASLIASIFFTTGVSLTLMGIVGVYVGRIFQEVKNRPLYVITEIVGL